MLSRQQQNKLQSIRDLSEQALEKELGLTPLPSSPSPGKSKGGPLPLPLPRPVPRNGEKKPHKPIVASRNFVLDNALNPKAALEAKQRRADEALRGKREQLAFGPGAKDVGKKAAPAAAPTASARAPVPIPAPAPNQPPPAPGPPPAAQHVTEPQRSFLLPGPASNPNPYPSNGSNYAPPSYLGHFHGKQRGTAPKEVPRDNGRKMMPVGPPDDVSSLTSYQYSAALRG